MEEEEEEIRIHTAAASSGRSPIHLPSLFLLSIFELAIKVDRPKDEEKNVRKLTESAKKETISPGHCYLLFTPRGILKEMFLLGQTFQILLAISHLAKECSQEWKRRKKIRIRC